MKNAIKQRIPKSAETLKKLESEFVGSVEKTSLKHLSLDELANRFEEIEQQGQLLQGRILLEARNRFPSDKEFGQWCITHSICVSSQQHRNRLLNLARFFEGRELVKIGISAAYEISAPINADIAEEVYEIAKGRNLPLAEVRRQIAIKKGEIQTVFKAETIKPIENNTKEVEIIETDLINEPTDLDLETQIMAVIENINPQLAIVALKNVIDKLNAKRYGK